MIGTSGHESLERIRREVFVLDLGFVNLGVRIALAVAHQETDYGRAYHQNGAAHQRVVGVRADEFHHVHAGHLSDERVVRGTRREVGADRTGQRRQRRRQPA